LKLFSIKELEIAKDSFKSEIAIVENAIAGINAVEMVTPINRLEQKKSSSSKQSKGFS
jgi:hypothetical protein